MITNIHTQDSFLFLKTALGGIRTHDTLCSRRALYQLSYQGSSAGWVQIQVYKANDKQVNLNLVYNTTDHLYTCAH